MKDKGNTSFVIMNKPKRKPVADDEVAINMDEAERFLRLLDADAERWTFQTWDDVKVEQDGELRPRDNKKLARILHGTLAEHADTLIELNERGAAIAVTMNETDLQGTKNDNIKRVRSIKLDLDGAPLDAVIADSFRPHIVVESSPDRFHCYYLVENFPLNEFVDAQKACAAKFDGDEQVALLNHRARLPGFFHMKSPHQPFRVRITDYKVHSEFGADEIWGAFPPMKENKSKTRGSMVVLPAGVPLEAAEQFVAYHYCKDEIRTLHYYRGSFYRWRATHYAECDLDHVRTQLYLFLKHARVKTAQGTLVPYNPTKNKINQVLDALQAGCYLDRERQTPFWWSLRDEIPTDNLIACRNGLLDIDTGKLGPHSAHFFNVNCLPFDYEPDAPEPKRWLKFLEEIWPNDAEAERSLQEIFGLLLTADTRYQKIFLLVGPKRSGKGTVAYVVTQLVGPDNVASPTMASLATQFGLSPLIDKRMAIVSDARVGSGADTRKAVEHLLSVSGEDTLTIDRKYRNHWTGKLGVRFMILTNELPRLVDESGAMASRFVLLVLEESFLHREDSQLKEKLRPELGGILNWAFEGLQRLRKRNYFEMPKSSLAALRQLEELTSPITAFATDRCKTGDPKLEVDKLPLYKDYKEWCEEHGQKPNSESVFGRALLAAFPKVKPHRSGSGGRRWYSGIALLTVHDFTESEAEAEADKEQSKPKFRKEKGLFRYAKR